MVGFKKSLYAINPVNIGVKTGFIGFVGFFTNFFLSMFFYTILFFFIAYIVIKKHIKPANPVFTLDFRGLTADRVLKKPTKAYQKPIQWSVKMAFIAKYNQNQVISLDYSHEDWIDLCREYSTGDKNLVCLECDNAMIPKKRYEYDTQFFAHKHYQTGKSVSVHIPEQGSPCLLHRYIQSEIYRLGKLYGFNVDIEHRLIDGKRVADVLVNDVVIEVQNISATESSLRQRTDDYLSDNKKVVWFLITPDEPKRSQEAKITKLLETLPHLQWYRWLQKHWQLEKVGRMVQWSKR